MNNTGIRIQIASKTFGFTLEAIEALNAVLSRTDVNALESTYKSGDYEWSIDPDAKRTIEVVQTTEWK